MFCYISNPFHQSTKCWNHLKVNKIMGICSFSESSLNFYRFLSKSIKYRKIWSDTFVSLLFRIKTRVIKRFSSTYEIFLPAPKMVKSSKTLCNFGFLMLFTKCLYFYWFLSKFVNMQALIRHSSLPFIFNQNASCWKISVIPEIFFTFPTKYWNFLKVYIIAQFCGYSVNLVIFYKVWSNFVKMQAFYHSLQSPSFYLKSKLELLKRFPADLKLFFLSNPRNVTTVSKFTCLSLQSQ